MLSDEQMQVVEYVLHGGGTVNNFCSFCMDIRPRRSRKAGVELILRTYKALGIGIADIKPSDALDAIYKEAMRRMRG